MKVVKRIFYGIMVLIIAACGVVLLCALNPKLTEVMKVALYGNENVTGVLPFFGLYPKEDKTDTEVPSVGPTIGEQIDSILDENGVNISDFIYEIPGEGVVVTLPDDVSDLTGFLPVADAKEQVTDKAAEDIKSTLSLGETGSKLTFDTAIYPFYAMLNADEQAVYRQIYANAEANISSFAPVKAITTSQLKKIFEAVTNDHPELFYLATEYSVKYTKSESVVEIILSYYTIENQISVAREKFEQAAVNILAGAVTFNSDYDKENYVHNALLQNVIYDAKAPVNQSAYSALVYGKTVCAGYARAFQYLMQKLGIPCYYCTGYSGEDHAWNIVKLSDGYYNVDVTWDDTDPTTYNYFNRSDSDFKNTHRRTSLSIYLPACTAKAYRGLEGSDVPGDVAPGDPNGYDDGEHITPMYYDEDKYGEGYNTGSGSGTGTGTGSGSDSGSGNSDPQDKIDKELADLGLTSSQVVWTIEDYYKDCEKKLVDCGVGDQHFNNIVPAALFDKITSSYGTGAYKDGYVNNALESLGMNHFSIQIQAQKIGNGYYKLYHNVVTWKE